MIKINELKERDVLKAGSVTVTILQNLGKVVIIEFSDDSTCIMSEKELNANQYELVPPTPEKKYFMGFEVREYPERPIVQVGAQKCLRRLIEVKENYVICENEAKGASPVNWDYVYSILETMIIEPSSSRTREGDGC